MLVYTHKIAKFMVTNSELANFLQWYPEMWPRSRSRSRNQGFRSWYRSRTVRPRAQVIFFRTYAIILFIQNALMRPQLSVLFAQLNSLP